MSFEDDLHRIYEAEKMAYVISKMIEQEKPHPSYEFPDFEEWKMDHNYE